MYTNVSYLTLTQYSGTWINGQREGVGELQFAGHRYKGNFIGDQVTCGWYKNDILVPVKYKIMRLGTVQYCSFAHVFIAATWKWKVSV